MRTYLCTPACISVELVFAADGGLRSFKSLVLLLFWVPGTYWSVDNLSVAQAEVVRSLINS